MTTRRRVWAVEDENGNVSLTRPETTPDLTTAVTAAALAAGGAGNVENGVHYYLVTFVTSAGETSFNEEDLGAVAATVVDKTSDGKVALSAIPLGSAFVTSRKIYRTAVGADKNIPANYKLLATIANNTATTYTDNIADASLGAVIPLRNTTANSILNYNSSTGAVSTAGRQVSNGIGAVASYTKTATGANTLLAAADHDRVVHIAVLVDEVFAAGNGAATVFSIGETSSTTKFKNGLNAGAAAATIIYSGTLSANKALLVTATPATGTGTGGITVAVQAMPAA